MWYFEIWISGHGGVNSNIGRDVLRGLFQAQLFCDSRF